MITRARIEQTGNDAAKGIAKAQKAILQAWVTGGLTDLKVRMGDQPSWTYGSSGGPDSQTGRIDEIKKIRFMIHYIESDRLVTSIEKQALASRSICNCQFYVDGYWGRLYIGPTSSFCRKSY